MAKISGLALAGALASTDLLPVARAGATKRASVGDVSAFVTALMTSALAMPFGAFVGETNGFLLLNDIETMFSDDAGTVQCKLLDQCRVWKDQSGLGFNATVLGGVVGPTVRMTKIPEANPGKVYLDFNAVALNYMVLPTGASIYDPVGKATVVAAVQAGPQAANPVYNEASTTANAPLYTPIQTGQTRSGGDAVATSTNHLQSSARSDGNTLQSVESSLEAFDNTPRILSFVDNARTISQRIDGRDQGSRAYAGTLTLNSRAIGAIVRSSVSAYFQGRIYGLMGVRKVLTRQQLANCERWMAENCLGRGDRSLRGAWTFYNDPRAIAAGDKLITSTITPDGMTIVGNLLQAPPFSSAAFPLTQFTSGIAVGTSDDHNNFALLRLASSGKILAIGTGHIVANYFTRTSVNADDATAWGGLVDIAAQLGSSNNSYANPIQFANFSGQPIFNFYRGKDTTNPTMRYSRSADDGATWSTSVKITETDRGYFRVAKNGTNRVDFCSNDTHPNDAVTNVYHFYMITDGATQTFYKTDGTPLTLPITPATALTGLSKVYDAAANGNVRSWVWDIAVDPITGDVVILYATFPDPATDHRYIYARLHAGVWTRTEICKAGPYVASSLTAEPGMVYYSGGIALDHADPNVVLASRSVRGGKHQVWRYETEDGGATFTRRQVTNDPSQACFRPVFARDQVAEPRMLYCAGSYQDYFVYDTRVVLANSLTGARA